MEEFETIDMFCLNKMLDSTDEEEVAFYEKVFWSDKSEMQKRLEVIEYQLNETEKLLDPRQWKYFDLTECYDDCRDKE